MGLRETAMLAQVQLLPQASERQWRSRVQMALPDVGKQRGGPQDGPCVSGATPLQDGSWRIPVHTAKGWFVTAETGTFSGAGSSSGCASFRSLNAGTSEAVIWNPPADASGTYAQRE